MDNWAKKVYAPAMKEKMISGRSWQILSMRVFKRDRFQCKRCHKSFCQDGLQLSAHHIIPRSIGGQNKMDNLITLCAQCHDFVELNPEVLKDIENDIDPLYDPKEYSTDWHSWVYGGKKKQPV